MNIIIAYILEQVFMKRDNMLGVYGFGMCLAFMILYAFLGLLQFALWAVACGILAFMGGLELKFDAKTKRQLVLFKQSFKQKSILRGD